MAPLNSGWFRSKTNPFWEILGLWSPKPRLGSLGLRSKSLLGVPKPRPRLPKPKLWVPRPRLEVPRARLGVPFHSVPFHTFCPCMTGVPLLTLEFLSKI